MRAAVDNQPAWRLSSFIISPAVSTEGAGLACKSRPLLFADPAQGVKATLECWMELS